MQTDYQKQANDFLKKHGLTLKAIPTDSGKCPPFCDGKHIHGDEHKITIRRGRQSISFKFWNSLNDSQNGKAPTAYDVLACISSDSSCPETFEDFCGDYGYDEDSRKAEKTFKILSAFARKLCAFFSEEELTDLSEIQ